MDVSEHRRRHGIPDDDKRPWHEAYPAALERRRPLLRRPNAKDTKSTALYDSAYDPYGRTIKDHFILEENAKGESDSTRLFIYSCLSTYKSSGKTSKNWTKQFVWVPLPKMVFTLAPSQSLGKYSNAETLTRIDMLSSARSSVAPDVGAQAGRVSGSPLKRIPSPSKLGIPSSANGTHPGDHPQRLVPLNAHSGTHGASKANGRKRLYMDPREDEPEKARSGGDWAHDDRTAAFSLPKRQRVNTWGTDSQANVSISLSNTLPIYGAHSCF